MLELRCDSWGLGAGGGERDCGRAGGRRRCHLVEKAVVWPGTQKLSYRTGNNLVRAAGYIVYNVVSNTHKHTNKVLCCVLTGSHKITRSQTVCHNPVLRPLRDQRSHAVCTAIKLTASMALCRCSRPAADTSITVGSTHHEGNCNGYQPALPMPGNVRDLPLRSVSAASCDCRATRPTARAAAPSG